jgi:pyruvate kinase
MSSLQPEEKVALQWRRTKLIATLGPASDSDATIDRLLKSGIDVVRLNLSHGNHDSHRQLFHRVREAAQRAGRHIAILMDLGGPKIRVGRFHDGQIRLRNRQQVTVTTRRVIGQEGLIPSRYSGLHKDVQPGERILLDDGHLELTVETVAGKEIGCRIVHGGVLKDNKGMNLPDSTLSVSTFTRKDREDAALAAELGADLLALSFVRSARDLQALQRHLKKVGREIPVIAKIEKPEAIEHIDSILDHACGIMVARGDLGIELAAERVPLIQRDLIALARRRHKPVIVATQMLESMTQNARPTRAEVGDVATAALAGADAVMLSGETASGKHPVRAVATMDRILREMESYQWQHGAFGEPVTPLEDEVMPLRKAVARAVTGMAHHLKLQGIIIPTRSGLTAQIIAAARPTAPCMGVSSDVRVCRRLALHWGIVPVLIEEEKEARNWRLLSERIAQSHHLTHSGNTVLLVSGFNDDPALSEPVMKILHLTR